MLQELKVTKCSCSCSRRWPLSRRTNRPIASIAHVVKNMCHILQVPLSSCPVQSISERAEETEPSRSRFIFIVVHFYIPIVRPFRQYSDWVRRPDDDDDDDDVEFFCYIFQFTSASLPPPPPPSIPNPPDYSHSLDHYCNGFIQP